MYSDERNWCSHQLGFPIRKSPDRRLLASSRGLSQLTTTFIASLRQGIHTHTLSSLTIKSISNTKYSMFILALLPLQADVPANCRNRSPIGKLQILVVSIARQIFNFQRSDFFDTAEDVENRLSIVAFTMNRSPSASSIWFWWAWIDSNYRPHPYQGCALAT